MSTLTVSVLISVLGLVLSLVGSAYVSGVRWGSVRIRLQVLESSLPTLATREQLAGVKEDLAEIKGMFRLAPRDGAESRLP